MKKYKLLIFLFLGVILSFFISGPSVLASGSTSVSISQDVVHSYNANSSVQIGMIVQIKNKLQGTIEPLTQNTINNMLGIVVPSTSTTVALIPSSSNIQQVYVASSGIYNVLVSDQGGSINSGDYVTISSLNGIGMKANQDQSLVIGRAVGNFNNKSNIVGNITVTSVSGKKQQIIIGLLPVDLNIMHNPLANKSASYVPTFLFKVAQTVAAKPVSALHIYLGLVVLLVTIVLAGILLYSGVKSGMIAIGRNPLSRSSIIRSLVQTILAGVLIFIIGIFAVYLLLKL